MGGPKKTKQSAGVVLAAGALVGAGLLFPLLSQRADEDADVREGPTRSAAVGLTSTDGLQSAYDKWSKAYAATNPPGPVTTLLWNRGLSSEFNEAKGIAQLDLARNRVSVRIKGLEDEEISDVWLVENRPGRGRSVLPEDGDRLVNVGSLNFEGDHAWLDAEVADLETLALDVVVIARRGEHPGRKGVLVGTTSLFQKMYHYPEQQAKRRQAAQTPAHARAKDSSRGLLDLLVPDAHASAGRTPDDFYADLDSDQINFGRELFFNETFEGNGRTCGTCHVEGDNLALGLETIAKLDDDDPLFIVEQEFRPDGTPNALYQDYRFERPALMRKVGLIFENLNGFREEDGNFTTRGAMRAPSHVLSIRTTLAPPPAFADDGTLPLDVDDLEFADRTGWSGDGTPTGFRDDFFAANGRDLTGSLRDFAVGAVIQHFTRTMERSGFETDSQGAPREPDFRFPTEEELDAIEAFMISVGRQEEGQDLNTIQLVDEVADRGRLNWLGFNVFDATPNDGRPPLNCQACHFNGGANTNPEFPFPPSVTPNHDLDDLAANGGSIPSHNRSFAPGVERLADQAADIIVQVDDDPSVAGDCFSQGLGQVPLLPGDEPGVPSEGCSANAFDNGFLFGFGDGRADERIVANRFNAQPVFEAMDTPPFFHGHQVNTIEGSVAFYAANRHFRNGDFAGAIVPLNAAQISNVARFMRVMGADFNAEQAITLLEKAVGLPRSERKLNVRLARKDIKDALQLLEPVLLHLQDAVPMLKDARSVLKPSSGDDDDGNGVTDRRSEINDAIVILRDAQAEMVIR